MTGVVANTFIPAKGAGGAASNNEENDDSDLEDILG